MTAVRKIVVAIAIGLAKFVVYRLARDTGFRGGQSEAKPIAP